MIKHRKKPSSVAANRALRGSVSRHKDLLPDGEFVRCRAIPDREFSNVILPGNLGSLVCGQLSRSRAASKTVDGLAGMV
jgi:hypothetical protein